ncbi:PadR family transcriptional regulator [Candidatus Peribacteria bacterium]|nr:MAG: PadR family transcriptional regulator [Candidatus Peribacteria bacterium]
MTPAFDTENTKAQMRKGTLEFCILLIINQSPGIYAPDILKKLGEIDMIVVEGTIYPLLSRLKRDGMLEYEWEESKSGPPRKLYTLTKDGKAGLKNLIAHWNSLSSSLSSLLHQ